MIENILAAVTHFITQTISALGYTGVVLLMAIESAAIPLPSEIIMPFAGFLALAGRFNLLALALAGAIGSTFGSWVTYGLGFYGGRPLVRRFGRFVLLSEKDLDLTERFFQRFGNASTFIGRLLPVVRTFISIPAGIGKAPLLEFTIYSFLGSFIWSYLLAWVGFKLGEHWKDLEIYFRRFDTLILVLLLLALAYAIKRHIKK
ncbi:MAG: alkaline phosphatase [Candidatus Doudnabacteria bacterium RIFCSPLOWO2_02_FULL_49_13]|uniref:Alkaline phosphatase n=1 Tax=Candidatus Doudnabacteria bacterium RIFCSPHIGHO2_12_FULL_48_16 TaxID=1817838 RepID=A0A1F5PKF6_9BACT|nr:MAG: alkaline phosphatase [Candidatus Doudnabacteria bacterium RIFCSPHIGHO2_02_FULL_49_24]OGE88696.1 MAG: alkaline phosphatase [Candidatus Doudnabacteria bacterium RIFCSPHIGHO2_01_FULL_50_67]OGE90381.1 MAG: alkaline phosphatase [Candidatus Doudnabacteria bacterium RIFCSPHIGHO2_12_FULL_48_16]OGE97088.1 MAG: alkaline phosphatase [Candidatus Doudnabacteria bacterium RIFCSPLOWO2_01_FULL_49_40]OGF02437.1 MAG: alkaline phosphatase [Candidatus Doudnabacteria bacterium RIFCSPLOWO2_02_FULL_49_13]OGF